MVCPLRGPKSRVVENSSSLASALCFVTAARLAGGASGSTDGSGSLEGASATAVVSVGAGVSVDGTDATCAVGARRSTSPG